MTTSSQRTTSGWVLFATTMFVIAGFFNIVYGLAMVFNNTWIVLTPDGAWIVDISAWGWITLVVGIIQFLAAWGVSSGQTWARIVGIIIATVAAANALFLVPIYPLWGLTILAIAVLIIYGLAIHGDEVT